MHSGKNFALVGAAGFVAPRHMRAIRDSGGQLLAVADPHDAVGIVDEFFPNVKYFREIERLDRFLEKLRRRDPAERVHFVSICSPNYLHDAHVRLALRVRAHAICEKPLVIKPWNLDPLRELEAETGCRIHTVLQLRLHPAIVELRRKLQERPPRTRAEIELTYVTRRGPWYHLSWKGDEEKSGGLVANIGIHFFDMLIWLFGPPERAVVHLRDPRCAAGCLDLERARIRWFLSVSAADLPATAVEKGAAAYRSLTIDGEEVDFSSGFADLHTLVYRDILSGGGFGTEDARPSIEAVHMIRESAVGPPDHHEAHPYLIDREKRQ